MQQRHMGGNVQLHTFLTLALDRGEWSASYPHHFRQKPPVPIRWKAGWNPKPVWTAWKITLLLLLQQIKKFCPTGQI